MSRLTNSCTEYKDRLSFFTKISESLTFMVPKGCVDFHVGNLHLEHLCHFFGSKLGLGRLFTDEIVINGLYKE
jgi:hypothetical protein